ncbi:MAG: hypothetical protein LBS29_04255 [Endomicrobium sp.]|jgi:hypothetical protein|nr:hypothetical protein [Endomicrobium sp.]
MKLSKIVGRIVNQPEVYGESDMVYLVNEIEINEKRIPVVYPEPLSSIVDTADRVELFGYIKTDRDERLFTYFYALNALAVDESVEDVDEVIIEGFVRRADGIVITRQGIPVYPFIVVCNQGDGKKSVIHCAGFGSIAYELNSLNLVSRESKIRCSCTIDLLGTALQLNVQKIIFHTFYKRDNDFDYNEEGRDEYVGEVQELDNVV